MKVAAVVSTKGGPGSEVIQCTGRRDMVCESS